MKQYVYHPLNRIMFWLPYEFSIEVAHCYDILWNVCLALFVRICILMNVSKSKIVWKIFLEKLKNQVKLDNWTEKFDVCLCVILSDAVKNSFLESWIRRLQNKTIVLLCKVIFDLQLSVIFCKCPKKSKFFLLIKNLETSGYSSCHQFWWIFQNDRIDPIW